ncbi:Protein Unc-93 B1 [Manis pentadactyla]|nr:Protein Unc-93 B1 [Manis pentadactyla]
MADALKLMLSVQAQCDIDSQVQGVIVYINGEDVAADGVSSGHISADAERPGKVTRFRVMLFCSVRCKQKDRVDGQTYGWSLRVRHVRDWRFRIMVKKFDANGYGEVTG